MDRVGRKEWEGCFGGAEADHLPVLRRTSDGGYILGGYSGSDVSGNKTTVNHGAFDFWVVKLDENGNRQWEANQGGTDDNYLAGLEQTDDGGYVLAGRTWSGVGGNKTSGNYGQIHNVEASADLISWESVIIFVATGAPVTICDTGAAGLDRRFYRIR